MKITLDQLFKYWDSRLKIVVLFSLDLIYQLEIMGISWCCQVPFS